MNEEQLKRIFLHEPTEAELEMLELLRQKFAAVSLAVDSGDSQALCKIISVDFEVGRRPENLFAAPDPTTETTFEVLGDCAVSFYDTKLHRYHIEGIFGPELAELFEKTDETSVVAQSTKLSRRERRNGQSEAKWARDRQIKRGKK